MSDKINLKEMEQKAYKLLNQDGLMELLMGAILFVVSSTFGGKSSFAPFLAMYVIFKKTDSGGFQGKIHISKDRLLETPR